jgi:iron/zinc/copper transport system permease protein
MIYLAAGFGALSSLIGLYFSFTYNLASGATIVIVAALFFTLAFFFSPSQGLLWKSFRNKKVSLEVEE